MITTFKKTTIAFSLLIGFATLNEQSAIAESSCATAIIAHSIAFRGAVVCNPSWLDRQGSYFLLGQAKKCNKSLDKTLVKRGFADFDKSVAALGKSAACVKLDAMLRNFE